LINLLKKYDTLTIAGKPTLIMISNLYGNCQDKESSKRNLKVLQILDSFVLDFVNKEINFI